MLSTSLSPDALAEAAARKAAQAPHGQKRFRRRVAKIARHLDLAFNVRTMRMSKRKEGGE